MMSIHLRQPDLYEVYLPHFEKGAREMPRGGFMGAYYNPSLGQAWHARSVVLTDILRNKWGF